MNLPTSPIEINAFSLSFWASMGTFLGGIVVVFLIGLLGADPNSSSTARLMGVLQSISAGVMIHMTAFHLIPESIMTISSRETMVYFFVGILVFGVLELVIIPFLMPHNHDDHEDSPAAEVKTRSTRSSPKKAKDAKEKQVGEGIKNISKEDAFELYKTSVITFIAMSMHNIPEGISVYLAALTNPAMGLQLAVAIMLHNIPEGMAVAIPIYASTGSIFKVLWWTFLNGIAEPAGVIFGAALLGPYLDEFVLSRCLASVAGIMFCISLHELYPVSIKYSGKTIASASLFLGMFICWAAMEVVETYFGGHGHNHDHHDIHHLNHGHSHHHHDHSHHHGH